ncbi:MAG: YegS/Rv2252/BmrU family lipid kinase [Lachnospiraceae bacterium]|nr:YegS/Rv2252/BmrU family lipid kinase [Lachnospiraceae bacterium]
MVHIVVNPAARTGQGQRLWEEDVLPYLQENKIQYTLHTTKEAGDDARIAAEICETEKTKPIRIVILGGDGSVNEFLQGLSDPRDVILGFVPLGSGNDLAKSLRIPKEPRKALDIIFQTGHVEACDLGSVTYRDGTVRRFIVSCGIGFDAAVCEEAMRSRLKKILNKLGLGKLTYLGIAVKQILSIKRASGTLTLSDGRVIPLKKLLFIAGMNQRYEGGGFLFGPKASDSDGQLDLCCVDRVGRPLILFALPFGLFGKHFIFPGITPYRMREYTIELDSPLWVHTDGEVSRQSDYLKVKSLPRAVMVMKPRG